MSTTSTPTKLRLSIVICAYTEQRWQDIKAAIGSVCSQTWPPFEVVLVVDHCPSLLERATRAFRDGRPVLIIPNDGPRGLSGARNSGFRACTGDVVAFLDDDATASPDWLEHLAVDFSGPDVVGVGGLVTPKWDAPRPAWFPAEFDWVVGCSHSGMPDRTAVVRNFVGANMAFRRDVLETLGGFSPALGRTGANAAGCEETELCIRASRVCQGAHLVYEPSAQVLHRVPPSRTTWRYFLRRCFAEGLSKARVVGLAGRGRGLASERTYLRSTIPRAILRSFGDIAKGHAGASLRALALATGTAATLGGYVKGTLVEHAPRPGSASGDAADDPPARQRRPLASPRELLVAAFTLLVVLELWALGITSAKSPSSMNDFGLLSILPATYYASLAVLTTSFVYWTRKVALRPTVLFAHVVVLLAIFHLTPAIVYGTLRYNWAWKHVAITDYVIAHHGVNLTQKIPSLVAYQDWPGFFTLNALLTSGSGFTSALAYASLAPFANELLYAGPLFLIFRCFSTDRRVHWTALWIFYLGNWIGQDYFSPQGFAFFLYLAVIGLCLRYLMRPWPGAHQDVWESTHDGRRETRTRARWTYAIVVVLTIAIASSHQLTPFMLVSALTALFAFRLLRFRSLPFITAGITAGWIGLAARTFVRDNSAQIFRSVGALFLNAKVVELNPTNASPDQLVVSHFDYALTAAIIALAIVGMLYHWRSAGLRSVRPAVLLAISPAVALIGNSYGGEIVFRVYLFGLPFLALFGAHAITPLAERLTWRSGLMRTGIASLLTVAFLFSYYGKEHTNYVSPSEIAAVNHLYRIAPPGSEIVGIVGNDPWPLENYNEYPTYAFSNAASVRPLLAHPVRVVIAQMAPYRHAYFLFTSSDAAEVGMTGTLPRGAYGRIEGDLLRSPRFRVVEDTPSVLALALVPAHAGPAPGGTPARSVTSPSRTGTGAA